MIEEDKQLAIQTMHESGCGIRKISRILKVSRNSVRKVIKAIPQAKKASRYEQIKPLVRQHFNECKTNATRLQQILLEKYDKDVPYSTLTKIVRELELRNETKKRRSGAYQFAPGQEMQHDTSPHQVILGGKKITAQCAILAIAYSKKVYIQYYPRFTRFEAKVFLTDAICYMKGSCRQCVIDNTAVMVVGGSGPTAVFSPEMEAFGDIFGMSFMAHRIKDPNRKAGAERNLHYAENNFLAARTFSGWNDLNRQAEDWCDKVANKKPKRSLKGLSPDEIHIMELAYLNPLPTHIPPVYQALPRIVDISGFVTIDTNRYSVPEKLCGQKVEAIKSWDRIVVYHQNRKVADHKRLIDDRDSKIVAPGHHPPLFRKKNNFQSREEKALTGRFDSLDQYVRGIKKHHNRVARRKLKQLLDLKNTYPLDAFKKAVKKAQRYGLYDLSRLENLILSCIAGDFFNLDMED